MTQTYRPPTKEKIQVLYETLSDEMLETTNTR